MEENLWQQLINQKGGGIYKRTMEPKWILITLTAERDSSKLDRNPWVMNGLNCSEPEASKQHSSHSFAGTSEIEETTETDILFTFPKSVASPYHNGRMLECREERTN